MLLGLGVLIARRLSSARVKASSGRMDYIISAVIAVNILTGSYQVFVSHTPLFSVMGPWLRGLLLFNPNPLLMAEVPLFMQAHVIAGFLLFALIPFSRMVHVFSVPVTYVIRPLVIFRKHNMGSE